MFFPKDLAEMCKDNAGRSYCPSNGTEGDIFQEIYCDKCAKQYHCKIIFRSQIYRQEDPLYPKEFVIGEDGQPTCTKFRDKSVKPPKRKFKGKTLEIMLTID